MGCAKVTLSNFDMVEKVDIETIYSWRCYKSTQHWKELQLVKHISL